MKVKVDKHIQDFLEEFELSEREVGIYLTLLRTGPNTIMNLARETGIKRSTTHNNVEELIKKGLVSQTNYGERRMVVAEEPDKLKFLMDQKKWKVKKLEESLPKVVDAIYKMVPDAKEVSAVEVKYYEGQEGVEYIYKTAFSSSELRSYVSLASVAKVFPDNEQIYLQIADGSSNGIVREIIDNSKESIAKAEQFAKNSNFEYRISTKPMNLSSLDILIFDNQVAMINFNDSVSGTIISNKEYYQNSKVIFDMLWEMLEKVGTE